MNQEGGAGVVRAMRKVNPSSAGNFWDQSGFLRFSHPGGSRSSRGVLGRGLRIAAAAEKGEEPRADCAGAEDEHDAVGPSLEGVPDALGRGRGISTGLGVS